MSEKEQIFPDAKIDQNEKERAISFLQKEPLVLDAIKQGILPKEELSLHPFMLEKWVRNKKVCENCLGLQFCKQTRKGYCEELYYDGSLDLEYQACSYQKEKQLQENHKSYYIYNDLPDSLLTVGFESIALKGEEASYVNAVKEALQACEEEFGRYFYGFMGTGKTYLTACILNRFAKKKHKVAFVHCAKYAQKITSYNQWELQTIIDPLRIADVVVFDDIGSEEVSDRYRAILLSILDERMLNHKMTCFTSNEDHESLLVHFQIGSKVEDLNEAKRIIERIQALSKPVKMISKDKRILYSTANQ